MGKGNSEKLQKHLGGLGKKLDCAQGKRREPGEGGGENRTGWFGIKGGYAEACEPKKCSAERIDEGGVGHGRKKTSRKEKVFTTFKPGTIRTKNWNEMRQRGWRGEE